jgi:competence protein ComEA
MKTRVLAGLLTGVLLAAAAPHAWGGQATAPATAARVATVDLNSATVADLEALPGVGRATAERIVEYRQKNGAFKKVEELMNVKGIGEKSFLKLKPLIAVSPKTERAGGDR